MRHLLKKVIVLLFLIRIITLNVGCSSCTDSKLRRVKKERKEKSKKAKKRIDRQKEKKTKRTQKREYVRGSTNVVKMKKEGGVYTVPIYINGTEMFFIFDTGASLISISETEATFLLKQGTLTKEDILRTSDFIDANGDISEGTIINLKTVKIGNKVLKNIEASVVHNAVAPLLLGQSALEKFGKVSIDYDRGEIILED